MVRAGIRSLLNRADDIKIIGEANDGSEALQLAESLEPDVLVLDLEMPRLTGVEVAQRLRAKGLRVRILALSAYNDREYITGMLANGAAGYLTKEEALETIIEAVRGVARGEDGWVSESVAERITTWMKKRKSNLEGLTEREVQLLHLVAEGKTNQKIGQELGIKTKTVEKHLRAIFVKLGVGSRIEAVDIARKSGHI